MRRRIAIVALVVVVAIVGIAVARSRLTGDNNSAPFRTAEVTRGDLSISVSSSGVIEAVSLVDVRSRATGQVVSVLVEESDFVVKGQLLVVIDDPDARAALENARTRLAEAQSRLAQAEAQLAIQRASTATGVRQAEASVAAARARLAQLQTPRREDVAQAEEAVRQAQANADLARQNLARHEQLYADGFISRAQLDEVRSQEQVAQSQLRAAQQRLQQVRAGGSPQELDAARADLAQAEAQLAAARNGVLQQRLRQEEVRAARVSLQSAGAEVRQAQDRVNEGRITAPVAGMVAKRSVAVGQSVIGSSTGGTPVLTLAQMSPLLARVMVDEADIARISPAARVEVTADALPGKTFRARVLRIAPQAVVEQNVTQYPVMVEILDDPQRQLKLGMTVDAEFVLARRANVLLVPQEAVRGTETKAVMIVEGQKLTPQIVQTGISDGRFVEILSGLREGDTVYLGPARSAPSQQTRPTNPFQPRFQPRR